MQFAKFTTSANIQTTTYKPNPGANHLYKYENNLQTTIKEPTTFKYEERKCKTFIITFSITPWKNIYTKCEILQMDELTNSTNIQITTYKESAKQSPNQLKKYRPLINLTFANLWQIQVTNLKGVEEGTFTFSFHKLYNMVMFVSQVALVLNLSILPPNGPMLLHHSEQMQDV